MIKILGQKWSELSKKKSLSEIAIVISSINIAFTAFTNLDDIVAFAGFVRWLSETWRLLIHNIVNSILSILRVEVSVDVSVFWFLYISFILLCALSYSKRKIAKSDLFDSYSLAMSLTFFMIIAIANKAIFLLIFDKSGPLAPMLQASATTFLVFIGSLLSITAVYKGRRKKMGFYIYQSSKAGVLLALFTLPIAIDLIMFVFLDRSVIFEWLASAGNTLSRNGWKTLGMTASILYVALLPSIFASPLFITNHAIISRRFALTNALVLTCFLINFLFLFTEKNVSDPANESVMSNLK
ncbi:hypothetical protein [Sulfitobacter sp. MF3-043]|uniref:hypothetical protein n=1 Tax=Sulfitobacter sediminivivens TaxID=3252902 RepID=UPI0036DE5DF3